MNSLEILGLLPELDPQFLLKLDRELELLALRLADGAADADDVRQEAWLAAANEKTEEPVSLGGWLARAIRFRESKRRRAERRRHQAYERAPALDHEQLSPEQILSRHEVRLLVMKAVDRLKAPYKQTITLGFFEGLPPREIARVMGVPTETVRTRTKRALAALRTNLDSDFGERSAWAAPILATNLWLSLGPTATGGSTTLSQVIEGVLLMSGKTKIALTIVFIAILSAAFYHRLEGSFDDQIEEYSSTNDASVKAGARRGPEDIETSEKVLLALNRPENDEPAFDETKKTVTGSEPAGSIELTVVNGSTGAVIPNIPVRLLPFGVRDPFFREESFTAGKNGKLVLDPWPAGTSLAVTPLGGVKRLRVEKGKRLHATLEIPAGTRVTGVVVTDEGQPVANAEIFASEMHKAIKGSPITTTDFEGRFEVKNYAVQLFGCLGARAPGHLPSPMVMIFESKGNEKEVRLILGGTPCMLDLVVVDLDGAPIPGARCLVGNKSLEQLTLPSGNHATRMTQFDAKTGADGHLKLDSLHPGITPILVRAKGFAPYSGSTTLKIGERSEFRVVLETGGQVTGKVAGPDGTPVANAPVTLGRYGSVVGHYMRTNDQGIYLLDNVKPGTRMISVESSEFGSVKGNVTVIAGQQSTWNAELNAVTRISGILLDEAGRRVPGLRVRATSLTDRSLKMSTNPSDAGGNFEIRNLTTNASYRLIVTGSDGLTKVAGVDEIRPTAELIRIVVPNDTLGIASMSGRIVGPDGKAVGGANVGALRGKSAGIRTTADGDGRFKFEKLIPGKYILSMNCPAYGYQRSELIEVDDGETLDLGDLAFSAGGHVNVILATDTDFASLGRMTVLAKSAGKTPTIAIKLTGISTVSQSLAPGHYKMSLVGSQVAYRSTELEIRAGETSTIRFDAPLGRTVSFSFEADDEAPQQVTYKIQDANGAILYSASREWVKGEPRRQILNLPLTPCSLVVEGATGRNCTLQIPANAPLQQRVFMK